MEKINNLKNLLMVGDKVLIKPKSKDLKTKSGLFLPPGYAEKENVITGYVILVGPGIPVYSGLDDAEEKWKKSSSEPVYIPLQAIPGDLAVFIQQSAVEIIIQNEKHFIVAHHQILMLERDDALFI